MTQLLPPSEQVENVSQFFQIHPENPQARLIKQAVEIIRNGGVVIYPTDSSYAIGCKIGDKNAVERVRRLRGLDDKHNFALICSDLSQLGLFAKIDTGLFRLLKAHLPGPYTFILNATREVPRLLLHPKKRTIGLRVPSHPIALALLEELGEPLMSVTLILPGDTDPLTDPYEMRQLLEHQVDLIIDGGFGGIKASTVINLADGEPEEPKEETCFHTLLLELDTMEEGLKTDFDDLLRDGEASEPDAEFADVQPETEVVQIEAESEPEIEPEQEDDILGVAEAREKLLAAVAALEHPKPELSDEEAEALALAEAIEAERREFED